MGDIILTAAFYIARGAEMGNKEAREATVVKARDKQDTGMHFS